MLLSCWSAKGGSGTTVVAAALALVLRRTTDHDALIVDLVGDVPAALGVSEPSSRGLADWLAAGADVPADGLARLELPVGDGVTLLPRGDGPLDPAERHGVLASMLSGDPRAVVVDCGRLVGPVGSPGPAGAELALDLARGATHSLLVTRACYLSLRRVASAPLRPSGVVLVAEPGRSLDAVDIEHVVGAPVVATVGVEPAVARAVDAGLLGSRLPRGLARALRHAA
jgi:hypothetical protein